MKLFQAYLKLVPYRFSLNKQKNKTNKNNKKQTLLTVGCHQMALSHKTSHLPGGFLVILRG